jgi:hypothetical protein
VPKNFEYFQKKNSRILVLRPFSKCAKNFLKEFQKFRAYAAKFPNVHKHCINLKNFLKFVANTRFQNVPKKFSKVRDLNPIFKMCTKSFEKNFKKLVAYAPKIQM